MNSYLEIFSSRKPPKTFQENILSWNIVLNHVFALEKSKVKRKLIKKNVFLCMTVYQYDASMNHTENVP